LQRILIVTFLFFVFFRFCSKDNSIATFGNDCISEKEFINRYTRFIKVTGLKDNLKLRTEYLKMLVDEKLLLNFADTSGWLERKEIIKELKDLADQICINYYFNSYILSDLKIDDVDLLKACYRSKIKIHARHLYARDYKTAEEIRRRLMNGESFESLAFEYFTDPRLAYNGGDLGWFSLGDMEPNFEEAAYSLEVGEISKPVKTLYGYSIIQVLDRKYNPFMTEVEFFYNRKKIEKILLKQKTQQLMMEKTDQILRELNIQINTNYSSKLFDNLNLIRESIKNNRPVNEIIGISTDSWIVRSKMGEWNIGYLIIKLSELEDRQWDRISSNTEFEKAIKGLVVRSYIEGEIERLNIRNKKEVREKIEKNRIIKILKLLVDEIMDTSKVLDSEIIDYYKTHPEEFMRPEYYNISEILVKDSVLASDIIEQLNRGANFDNLAMKFSLLKRSFERGGLLGWISKKEAGPIAEYLIPQSVGKVIGPIRIKYGYLILRINEFSPSGKMSVEEAKDYIIDILRAKAERRTYLKFVSRLRSKAGVTINNDRLRWIKINYN